MPFKIIRDDISRVKADAIVNSANPNPTIGRGTDIEIYQMAGFDELLNARRDLGKIEMGDAKYTSAFNLDAKYIIHTVGPKWIDGSHDEREILRNCYRNSLKIAEELKCESVAFPLISSGTYGFPKDEALSISLSEIENFLLTRDMDVTLVVFDKTALVLSEKIVGGIEKYIDENAVGQIRKREYSDGFLENLEPCPTNALRAPKMQAHKSQSKVSLDDIIVSKGESFKDKLFTLIDERGLDDVTVYKRANIDRKVFSSIKCKENYRPKKKTALALAIALKLNLEETRDLLSRAELAFSPSNEFDLIIKYFIENEIYDIFEINAALFKYDQPTLG